VLLFSCLLLLSSASAFHAIAIDSDEDSYPTAPFEFNMTSYGFRLLFTSPSGATTEGGAFFPVVGGNDRPYPATHDGAPVYESHLVDRDLELGPYDQFQIWRVDRTINGYWQWNFGNFSASDILYGVVADDDKTSPPHRGWGTFSGGCSYQVLNPRLGEVVYLGTLPSLRVDWLACNCPKEQNGVSVSLFKGEVFLHNFYERLVNDGSVLLTLPLGLANGADYRINITSTNWLSGGRYVSAASAPFTIYTGTGNPNRTRDSIPFDYFAPAYDASENILDSSEYGARIQSIYVASDLSKAGLMPGERLHGLSFFVKEAPLGAIHNFRLAYRWSSACDDDTFAFSFHSNMTLLYGPASIPQFQWQAAEFRSFPMEEDGDAWHPSEPWDGVSNLVLELSYANDVASSFGDLYFEQTPSKARSLVARSVEFSTWPDSFDIPGTPRAYVMSVLLTRRQEARCEGLHMELKPLPRLLRITGSEIHHDSYGWYWHDPGMRPLDSFHAAPVYWRYPFNGWFVRRDKASEDQAQFAWYIGQHDEYYYQTSALHPDWGFVFMPANSDATPYSAIRLGDRHAPRLHFVPFILSGKHYSSPVPTIGVDYNVSFITTMPCAWIFPTFYLEKQGVMVASGSVSGTNAGVKNTGSFLMQYSRLTDGQRSGLVSVRVRNFDFDRFYTQTPPTHVDALVLSPRISVNINTTYDLYTGQPFRFFFGAHGGPLPGRYKVGIHNASDNALLYTIDQRALHIPFTGTYYNWHVPIPPPASAAPPSSSAAALAIFRDLLDSGTSVYLRFTSVESPSWSFIAPGLGTLRQPGAANPNIYDSEPGSVSELQTAIPRLIPSDLTGMPLNTRRRGSRVQSIFLASELRQAGLIKGSTITAIFLLIAERPGADVHGFRIASKWLPASFTHFSHNTFVSDLDVLFGPSNIDIDQSDPSANFTLTEWTTWDGVSNLVLEFSHASSLWSKGGGVYMKETGSPRTLFMHSDSFGAPSRYPFAHVADLSSGGIATFVPLVRLRVVCDEHAEPCSGYGVCGARGACECEPGFLGMSCQIGCQDDVQCYGHGSCDVTASMNKGEVSAFALCPRDSFSHCFFPRCSLYVAATRPSRASSAR